MMDDYDTNQKEFFSGWKVERLIGIGGFGKVYKISKNITSKHKIYSAAKVITIPTDEEKRNIDLIYSTENDDTKAKYVEKMVEKITSEISLLYLLRGHSNIINYEDHSIEKKKDENSWDIIIKMEYAKSLNDYIGKKQLNLEEIVKIGIDITESLSFCESNNIIHRDIKESNIFVSKNNVFKLGDFGVSRDVTDFSRVSTKVGTISYMAPEVFNGKKYDIRADIYSLGLLLYKLLNHNRLPFLPVYPENFSFENLQNSQIKRYSGETFPKINNCPQDLFDIILKACSFSPLDRFETPREFNKLLIQILTKLNNKNKESINIESANIESIYNQETLEIKSKYNNSNRKNINDEVNQTNNINTNIDNDILNFETIYVGNDSEKINKNNTDLTDISILDYLSENEKNIFNSLDGHKQNAIGNNYFYGIDEQNYKKAFIWYEKAAQNGVLEAYKNLGYIYYRGYGVNKDYEKAKNYFIKAAIKGEEFSISKLKIMHRDGQIDNLEYNKIKRLLL